MQRLGRKLDGSQERARAAGLLDGTYRPPVPRPAVSVVLTRPGSEGLEIFMLRRAATMAFMPGRLVFPGGGVDEQDRGTMLLDDAELAEFSDQLGLPLEDAQTKLTTAVRETFEETRVLLARPRTSISMPLLPAEELERHRNLILNHAMTIAELLDRYDLKITASDLKPWARWVTPAIAPVRFDVTFFFAALPAGQFAVDISSEAQDATWWRPDEALARAREGGVQLATTQRELLTELAEIRSLARAFDTRRSLAPICLQPVLIENDYYLAFPKDPGRRL